MKKIAFLLSFVFILISCSELISMASSAASTLGSTASTSETSLGLKSALDIGVEKAVTALGVTNGFYGNTALKILLPSQAQTIVKNISLIPGGSALVDKAVFSMNRAAEDAVVAATPIFKSAILNMSFTDAVGILMGNDSAATHYLRNTTYSQLETAFSPKIKTSLDKDLVFNTSTNKLWSSLTTNYNKVANNTIGQVAGLKAVNVDLDKYVTDRALDALFVKIAEQEKAIRTNPVERTTALLKTVFAKQDNK